MSRGEALKSICNRCFGLLGHCQPQTLQLYHDLSLINAMHTYFNFSPFEPRFLLILILKHSVMITNMYDHNILVLLAPV